MKSNFQQELAIIGNTTRPVVDLPDREIASLVTIQGAYRLCLSKTPYTHKDAWELMGYDPKTSSRLTTYLNADYHRTVRQMPPEVEKRLQKLCGNRAPRQWRDFDFEGLLLHQRTAREKIEELEQRVAADQQRLKELKAG